MRGSSDETRFLGMRKDKLWTYLIVGILIVVLFIVLNYVIADYGSAKAAALKFLGLPGYLYPIIIGAIGLVVWYLGTKIETDWPEVVGAGLIAVAVGVGEIMIGWRKFAVGGMSIVPILLPVVTFLVFIGLGVARSK
jgi:uncharacterized integral membrane protein